MKPLVLIQLSDPHIGASWGTLDPLGRLRATIAAVHRLADEPDAVVVSGDLTHDGTPDQYALVKTELAALDVPIYVIPGNHDDRAALRACFGLPGGDSAPIDYVADLGPLRLFLLDSTIPGEDGGALGREQVEWLGRNLAESGQPALVVLHHPPVRIGIDPVDSICLDEQARLELGRLSATNPHMRAVAAGHLHRAIMASVGCCPAFTAPSAYSQFAIDPTRPAGLRVAHEDPPAFLIHRFVDDELSSYVQLVIDP
jgi:3',5'-cyclic-AMP phosphodiesterase